jgi:hypothetical protein
MPDPSNKPAPSTAVQWAAALFLLHGLAVAANLVLVIGAAGWPGAWDVPRALLRLVATCVVGGGLLRQARWAWWLGLFLGSWWLTSAALAILVFERKDVYWLPPSGFQVLLFASLACLGGAMALLLSPSARAVFRRRAA